MDESAPDAPDQIETPTPDFAAEDPDQPQDADIGSEDLDGKGGDA